MRKRLFRVFASIFLTNFKIFSRIFKVDNQLFKVILGGDQQLIHKINQTTRTIPSHKLFKSSEQFPFFLALYTTCKRHSNLIGRYYMYVTSSAGRQNRRLISRLRGKETILSKIMIFKSIQGPISLFEAFQCSSLFKDFKVPQEHCSFCLNNQMGTRFYKRQENRYTASDYSKQKGPIFGNHLFLLPNY